MKYIQHIFIGIVLCIITACSQKSEVSLTTAAVDKEIEKKVDHGIDNDKLVPFKDGHLWGFKNVQKKIVVEPIYEDIEKLVTKDFFAIKRNGLWGVMNMDGKETTEPQLNSKPFVSNTENRDPYKNDRRRNDSYITYRILTDNYNGIINEKGALITEPIYNIIDYRKSHDLYAVAEFESGFGLKYGLLNEVGDTIIAPKYGLHNIRGNCVMYYIDTDRALYNLDEYKFTIDFHEYDNISFSNYTDLIIGRKGDIAYILDRSGQIKFSKETSEIRDYGNIYFLDNGDLIDVYNEQFEKIDSGTYEKRFKVHKVSSNQIVYKLDGQFHIKNITGKQLEYPKIIAVDQKSYEYNSQTGVILLVEGKDDLPYYVLLNNEGEIVAEHERITPSSYSIKGHYDIGIIYGHDYIDTSYSNTHYKIKENGKTGIIDSNGVVVIKAIYDDMLNYQLTGLTPVKQNGKWGYISSDGTMIIEPRFDFVTAFGDSKLARVVLNDKAGYVNQKGKLIVDHIYDTHSYNVYERIEGTRNHRLTPIKNHFDFTFDRIKSKEPSKKFNSIHYHLTVKDGKYGLIDDTGKELIDNKCTNITREIIDGKETGFCVVKMEKRTMFYSFQNELIGDLPKTSFTVYKDRETGAYSFK